MALDERRRGPLVRSQRMGSGERVGRAASTEDIPAVAECLASAFYDDPLWGHWSFPDVGVRRRDLLPFMTLMAERGLGVWTDMTAAAESVTVWTPPGAHYESVEEERMTKALDDLFGARAPAIRALFGQLDAHTPQGRFYHLEWWATRRDHAGRGLGTALLRENLERVDAEHLPSYLESTNPANMRRYEALGFCRVDELAPPGGPTITTMWREAGGAAT
jgi:GNAT superfamily N-acetyltransferase